MTDKRTPLEWAEIFGLGYRHGKRGDPRLDLKIDWEAQEEYLRGYEQGEQDANKPYE